MCITASPSAVHESNSNENDLKSNLSVCHMQDFATNMSNSVSIEYTSALRIWRIESMFRITCLLPIQSSVTSCAFEPTKRWKVRNALSDRHRSDGLKFRSGSMFCTIDRIMFRGFGGAVPFLELVWDSVSFGTACIDFKATLYP
jgi:hypothetical protein